MSGVDYTLSRRNMVESQIRTNRVTDQRIIDAIGKIPREQFVPKHLENLAYIDHSLEISPGRYLMESMVFARLIQGASVRNDDICLDVGCGSGYSSVVLGEIAGTVVALESNSDLAKKAESNFKKSGADNIFLITAPLDEGYSGQAPYDVIVVNGSVERLPEMLLNQLNEGGRLVSIISKKSTSGRAKLFEKRHGHISERELFDATAPDLPGHFYIPKKFNFD